MFKQRSVKRQMPGFTLIEFIMVIVIMGILFSLGGGLLSQGFQATYSGMDIIRADWQARLAFERMSRELRLILNQNSLNISVPNQITFIDTAGENITYALSGNQLVRNNKTLASGVSTLNFTYYDRNRNVISSAAQASLVRFIVINMVITEGNTNHSFYTGINPRNLT